MRLIDYGVSLISMGYMEEQGEQFSWRYPVSLSDMDATPFHFGQGPSQAEWVIVYIHGKERLSLRRNGRKLSNMNHMFSAEVDSNYADMRPIILKIVDKGAAWMQNRSSDEFDKWPDYQFVADQMRKGL